LDFNTLIKMKNIIKFLSVILMTFYVTSCNRDAISEVNVDPSLPTTVEPIYLLPSIQAQMATGIQWDARFIGKYIQNFSHSTAYNTWDQYGYDRNSDNAGAIWRMAYWNIGLNLSNTISEAHDAQRYDIEGMGKAIRAWTWQVSTDYHSDLIKFDQVFTQRLNFDYGTQEEAYAEVKRLAIEGIADMQRTDGLSDISYTSKGDKIYNGETTKWIKFAYGILARNANNLSNKSTYNAQQVIDYVDLSLASTADDCYVKHAGITTSDANFFGPLRNNLSLFRQTDFILKAMDGTNTSVVDPRMANILVPSQDLTFRGNPLNTTAGTVTATRIPNLWGTIVSGNATTPGRYLFRNTASFPLMTYSEMQFIKAEAAFHLGNKILALDAYKKGIEASIDMVNANTIVSTTYPITALITAAQKTAFVTNVNIVPTDPNNLTLSQIMMQKYIALFGYGFVETWTDMRKYHYNPAIYTGFTATAFFVDNGGPFLAYRVRPRYNSEYVWNFAAIQSIGADQPNYHVKEMWYSQP
jgi:hypothetical protein